MEDAMKVKSQLQMFSVPALSPGDAGAVRGGGGGAAIWTWDLSFSLESHHSSHYILPH